MLLLLLLLPVLLLLVAAVMGVARPVEMPRELVIVVAGRQGR